LLCNLVILIGYLAPCFWSLLLPFLF
jgi:hypothetical protein